MLDGPRLRRGSSAADTAALWHLASQYRCNDDKAARALIGRANRWLHWRYILSFKEVGYGPYDCGGMFTDESVADNAHVNEFKREFGGVPLPKYNCMTPMSLKRHAYIRTRVMLKPIRAVKS